MIRALPLLAAIGALAGPATAQEATSFPRPAPQVIVPAPERVARPSALAAAGAVTASANHLQGARPAQPRGEPLLRQVRHENLLLQSVTFPPRSRVAVIAPPPEGKGEAGHVLLQLAAAHRPDALISGGYLASYVPPEALGLVQIGGDRKSRPHRSWLTTAMLCAREGGSRILPFDARQARQWDDCLQAGPILVEGGTSRYPADDLPAGEARLAAGTHVTGFVCIDRADALVMGLTSAATLDELGPALVEGLGCVEAMRLTGSETAGLYVSGTGLLGENRVGLPSAIAAWMPED